MHTAMIALGGNSISQKGKAGDISLQFAHTSQALDGISHFITRNYNLCINHGKKVLITCIPYIENSLNETAGTIIRN